MCCANKMSVAVAGDISGDSSQQKISVSRKLKDYEEYICGWGSAFINIMITFPINKVIFRQMLHGVDSQHAIRQLKMEGSQFLYRGCLPPLLQKTASVSLMFGTFKSSNEALSQEFPALSKFSVLVIAATFAGGTEALLTPFERIQTLLQNGDYNTKFKNTYSAFVNLRQYGFKEYYRGFTPILIRNSVGNILFFSLKDKVKDDILPPASDSVVKHLISDFISGAFVGALTSTIFYPMNVVKTQMQSSCGSKFDSIVESFKVTYRERGCSIKKMYLGVHANYTRSFLSWGIINASHQLLKRLFFSGDDNKS